MAKCENDHRSGFTLMEIVLVLAIFVAVAAAAVPIYHGTLQRERVRKVAEAVAADWTRTRARAIETGETQLWICTIATGSYSASAYNAGGGALTNSQAVGMAAQSGAPVPTGTANGDEGFGESLPEGVTIGEVLVSEADTILNMGATTNSGESGAATLFFYPDGTSSSARITVQGEDGRAMAVVINGTAGTVRVFPAESNQ